MGGSDEKEWLNSVDVLVIFNLVSTWDGHTRRNSIMEQGLDCKTLLKCTVTVSFSDESVDGVEEQSIN